MRQLLLCALLGLAWGVHADEPAPYVLMGKDLAPIKNDFNEAVDQVRLVFIVGPT